MENVTRRLLVDMTHLKKVGAGSRFLLGPLAGNAEVNVAVKVVDGGKTMSDFALDTSATDWSGFAGTTEETLAKVAERITLILQDPEEAKKFSAPR